MLGGVCGGIAEYLNLPSTAVRLACVFLTFVSGWPAVMYLFSLAVIPADPKHGDKDRGGKPVHRAGHVWGFILVCFGFLLLSGWMSDQWEWWGGPFGGFWNCHFWHPLPLRLLLPALMILAGVGLWIRGLPDSGADGKPEKKRDVSGPTWMRSSTDRVISGVCGGLAERFRIDSTWVRLLAVLFALTTAVYPALLLYVCLWIVLPKKN
jgi:phage shock protein C